MTCLYSLLYWDSKSGVELWIAQLLVFFWAACGGRTLGLSPYFLWLYPPLIRNLCRPGSSVLEQGRLGSAAQSSRTRGNFTLLGNQVDMSQLQSSFSYNQNFPSEDSGVCYFTERMWYWALRHNVWEPETLLECLSGVLAVFGANFFFLVGKATEELQLLSCVKGARKTNMLTQEAPTSQFIRTPFSYQGA